MAEEDDGAVRRRERPAPEAAAPERPEPGAETVGVAPTGEPILVRRPVRRTADLATLAAAAAVLALTWALAAPGRVSSVETSVFHAVNRLPGWLYPIVIGPMQLGSLAAVPVVALVAGIARRWWMAVAVGSAGLAAYVVARIVKVLVDRGRPLDELHDVVVHGARALGGGFPSGHSAVSAAIVLAAVPYLAWRWRDVLLAVPLLVAFARVYVGAHLPLDVVGGLAIGVAVASAVHLAIGRPSLIEEELPPEEVAPPPREDETDPMSPS